MYIDLDQDRADAPGQQDVIDFDQEVDMVINLDHEVDMIGELDWLHMDWVYL
jgi:hypothetical protein